MKYQKPLLHTLAATLALSLALYLQDPHLLRMRPFATPALPLAAVVAIALAWRRPFRPWRAAVVIVWLVALGLVLHGEYRWRGQRAGIFAAQGEEARRLAGLGQHLVVGYHDPAEAAELVRRGLVAGLFVTRRNADGKSIDELRAELAGFQALRREAGLPPLMLATDQEGGTVSRLSPPLPLRPPLGEAPDAAFAYGAAQGRDLAGIGINTNFSPVVDLKPDRPSARLDLNTRIAERAISADPATVSAVALAYARGLWSQGVLPTAKHFPGLGGVDGDTHHADAALDRPRAELEARDWRPFRDLIAEAPTLLMVGHASVTALDPGVPASLSRPLLTGVVRQAWGHDGVLISDDMTMAAVYDLGLCDASLRALEAGIDLLLIAYDADKVYPVLECLAQADRAGGLPELAASRARLARMAWRGGAAQGEPRAPLPKPAANLPNR